MEGSKECRKCARCGRVYPIEMFELTHPAYGNRYSNRCIYCRQLPAYNNKEFEASFTRPDDMVFIKLLDLLATYGNVCLSSSRYKRIGGVNFFECWFRKHKKKLSASGYKCEFTPRKWESCIIVTMERKAKR